MSNNNNNNEISPLKWVLPDKKEFVKWIDETFIKYRATGKPENVKAKFTPFKYQKFLRDYMGNDSPYRGILLYHELGSGKCHGYNTPILMYDGSIKMVQDVKVGELLMGDDSTSRKVLSLATGEDVLYEIRYIDFSYVVNSEHILVLQNIKKDILEITVKDYLKMDKADRSKWYGYRVSVEFPYKETKYDPYEYGLKITDISKHISDDYIINSKSVRLRFLKGILDANLANMNPVYENEKIIYLHRSLGLDINQIYDFEVIKNPRGNYYGFVIDNNNRYLLGDFSVTHNTCTAITIAEKLKTERNVVVMLPASLKNNFIYDGLLFCGDPDYKDKYSFVSYNANNTVSQINKLGSLDNKVIIIEEVHNLISKIVSGISGSSKQGLEIYNILMNAQNAKIIALSGTPIINDPFESAVLFNILRGYMEITYFRIIKVPTIFGNTWNFTDLEADILKNEYVDYIEINKINRSIEIHFKIKSYSENYQDVISQIEELCKNKGIIVKFLEVKRLPLFPIDDDGEIFKSYFVKEDFDKGNKLKNEEIYKRRILGLVSYYRSNMENYPKIINKDYYRADMSDYQFQMYELLRSKERLSERGGGGKSKGADKRVKSTFRVFSRQACNFVFPEEINRPYPDPFFSVSLKKENKNANANKNSNKNNVFDSKKINKLLKMENMANETGKMPEEYKVRISKALDKLSENGELYLTSGPDGLDKLSPKMKIMLENIQKSPGLVFVYSNFRTLEGIEIFSRILDFNGFERYGLSNGKKPKYAIYSGLEDEKEKNAMLKTFKSTENKHGKLLKILMATSAGAEGLDLKNIRQIHIMEPYWNQMRIEQVIGRGVRRNSHIALPPSERNIEIFRYFSVFKNKNALLTKDKMSTDEYIEQISLRKQTIINEVLNIFKMCAFDCVLNSANIKGSFDCFNFGKNDKGIAYYPTIQQDLIESHVIHNKKKVKVSFTKAIYYDSKVYLFEIKDKKPVFFLYSDPKKKEVEIDIKKSRSIMVDKAKNEVFTAKSIIAGEPILIGKINGKSEVIKA